MPSPSIAPGLLLPVTAGASVRIHVVGGETLLRLTEPQEHVLVVADAAVHGSLTVECGTAKNVDIEVILHEDSRLTMVMVTPYTPKAVTVRQRTHIASGAHLHLLNVSLGAALSQECESRVTGEGGVSSIDWIAYAKGNERQKLSVRNIFDASCGGGEVTMRAVAEHTASADVRGMIDIGADGGGTHTYLTQQVLMLDTTAKIDASPALEIKTNDVKASHSASVSRVTPEDLYYFAARGIDPGEARGLLVKGFLHELAARVPHVADMVEEMIERKYAAV